MPNSKQIKPIDFEKIIIEKVKKNEITMRPRWHFVIGSIMMLIGIGASTVIAIFLVNLILFSLRQHGPNGAYRLQMMLSSIPWWMPVCAVGGMGASIWFLRQFDFSYKKNFWFISGVFISSIILAAVVIDFMGLNDLWFRRGPMRRLYPQSEQPQRMYNGRGFGTKK